MTKPDEIAAAAARLGDVTLLINNAGIGASRRLSRAGQRRRSPADMFETNFFGMLRMSKAFAPILKANGGGALLNVLSIASWVNGGLLAAYAASKSAAWSLTNSLRFELARAAHAGAWRCTWRSWTPTSRERSTSRS